MTDTTILNTDLKHIPSTRRREMQDDVYRRISDGCNSQPPEVRDAVELSDDNFHEDMELALLQLRWDVLIRVDEALLRLDVGAYGSCSECAGEISQRRLRALPFAVRCQTCEEKREQAQEHARHVAQWHDGSGASCLSRPFVDRAPVAALRRVSTCAVLNTAVQPGSCGLVADDFLSPRGVCHERDEPSQRRHTGGPNSIAGHRGSPTASRSASCSRIFANPFRWASVTAGPESTSP